MFRRLIKELKNRLIEDDFHRNWKNTKKGEKSMLIFDLWNLGEKMQTQKSGFLRSDFT